MRKKSSTLKKNLDLIIMWLILGLEAEHRTLIRVLITVLRNVRQLLALLIPPRKHTTTQHQVPSKQAHGEATSSNQNMFMHTLLIEHSGY